MDGILLVYHVCERGPVPRPPIVCQCLDQPTVGILTRRPGLPHDVPVIGTESVARMGDATLDGAGHTVCGYDAHVHNGSIAVCARALVGQQMMGPK